MFWSHKVPDGSLKKPDTLLKESAFDSPTGNGRGLHGFAVRAIWYPRSRERGNPIYTPNRHTTPSTAKEVPDGRRSMKKIRLAPGPFVLPMPTVLIAATVNDVRNFIPVPFIHTANFRPVVVACGINPSHHTSSGISSNGTFSINLPGVDLLEATDWCGLHSGKQTDKSKVFKTFSGELENAPMLEACRLAAECRLITTVEFPVDTVYFG